MEVVDTEKKASNLDEILQDKLEKAFHKQTSTVSLHDIAKIAVEHSPIDLAFAVSHLPPNARPVLYDNLPDVESKVSFIVNTDSDTRLRVFRYMTDFDMKELFNRIPTDEAVWVLEDMPERRFRRVLDLIDIKKAIRIKELKKHRRNSAGRLMSSEFFAFTMNSTIGEVADYIRDNPRVDFTLGIYVVNEGHELQGYVPPRNLLINSPELPLRQVMRPVLYKVNPDATREEVVDIVERYKISSLPVVDSDNNLLGVIAHEDVVEAMEDLADETLAQMAGTAEKVSYNDSVFKRFLARAPWLFVTLAAGLVNVGLMTTFDSLESGLFAFALFFVPLITGMSGNVGLQCSTVLVRGMAIGLFSGVGRKEAVWKEIMIGLCAGVAFGLICGFSVAFLTTFGGFGSNLYPASMGIVVGSGLLGASFSGTILGVFSPIFFSKIGIDPAISSGPIITAFNDILSMIMFFLITWGLGNLFF